MSSHLSKASEEHLDAKTITTAATTMNNSPIPGGFVEYPCALLTQTKPSFIIQGRLRITPLSVIFYANILGILKEEIEIKLSDIVSFKKSKTALIFPTAIKIRTMSSSYTFTNLVQRDTAFNILDKVVRLVQQEVKDGLDETNRKIDSTDTAFHENDMQRGSSSQFEYYSTSNFSLSPETDRRMSSTSQQSFAADIRSQNITPPSSIAPSQSSYVDANDHIPESLDGFAQNGGLLDGGFSMNEIYGSLTPQRRTSISIGSRIKSVLSSTRSRQSSSENLKGNINSETTLPDRRSNTSGGFQPKRPVFWNLDGPEVDINSLRRRTVTASSSYVTTPEPSIHQQQYNDEQLSFPDKRRSTIAISNSTAPSLERRWRLSPSPLPAFSTMKAPELNIQQYSMEKTPSKLLVASKSKKIPSPDDETSSDGAAAGGKSPTESLTDSESRTNRSGFFQTFSVSTPVPPTSTSRGVILPNRRGARRIGGTGGTVMAQRRRSSSLGRHNIYQEAAVELARMEKAKNAATVAAATATGAAGTTATVASVDDGEDHEVQSILADIDGNISASSTNNGSISGAIGQSE
ncbi:hypothetical protein HK100_003774 [Physocladia obscura]|uniref:GRAM domain-containing protein n=1 Tax=Physocladia obscura TaxID=109957 RepID=A0AAD5XGW5_9FUNG|nr:hypothetical protein HK100_003774 [Physocladia obscura]